MSDRETGLSQASKKLNKDDDDNRNAKTTTVPNNESKCDESASDHARTRNDAQARNDDSDESNTSDVKENAVRDVRRE